jgi:hypothetical protein
MMAYTLAAFLEFVDELTFEDIPDVDNSEINDAGRYRQVRAAVMQYSRDFPDHDTVDVTGDGGRYYPITDLTNWIEDFSAVSLIEYPAAALESDEAPVYLDDDQWRDDYWGDVGGTRTRYIYLDGASPSTSEEMRVTYTMPYTWSASSATTAVNQDAHGFSVNDWIYYNGTTWVEAKADLTATHRVIEVADADNFTAAILQTTTPQEHFSAICHLAACYICRAIAAKYSRIGDSLVSADSSAHVTKAQEFSARSKEFCAAYRRMMGLPVNQDAYNAAGKYTDLDTAPGWPTSRRYLFHGRSTR